MKHKLIVDFDNPDMKEMVDYLHEYAKNRFLDIEFVGYSTFHEDHASNRPYYAIYYANRMGNTLDFLKALLEGKEDGSIDITKLDHLSDVYKQIGYSKEDMIDALIEGDDYETMHDVFREILSKKGIAQGALVVVYDDKNPTHELVCDLEKIKEIHKSGKLD